MAAISREAIQLGYTVRFTRVSDMLTLLHEASAEKKLGATMKTLLKVDLLSLDELGYITLSTKKAQLLFDVIAKRSEMGSSVFVTSNLEYSKWTDCVFRYIRTGIPEMIRTAFRRYADTNPEVCGQQSGGIWTPAACQ
jgi:DNA replication protein DnaC